MKTTIMACFTGICLLGAVYVSYKLHNLTSLLSQVSVQTIALNERIMEAEALNRKNFEEIKTAGKRVEGEKLPASSRIEIPAPGEAPPALKNTAKMPVNTSPKNTRERTNAETGTTGNTPAAERKPEKKASPAPKPAPQEMPASFSAARPASKSNTSMVVLKERMQQLKDFARKHSLDKEYALIADMGVNAGKRRFYMVNLDKMAVTQSGLMAYNKKRSDNEATHIYRVEKTGRDYYELYSLDKNGEVISPEPEILSPVSCIPEDETNDFSCASDIGPGISPEFFGKIQQLIKVRKNPVILWMFK